MLYEMLAGQRPFQAPSLIQMAYAVRETQPERPRSVDRSVPKDLEAICWKCLQKQPENRYTSCRHLADDLGRWLRDEPVAARPISAAERLWRWCRRNPAVAGLSASAGLLLAMIVAVATVGYFREVDLYRKTQTALDAAESARGKEAEALREADDERRMAIKERDAAEESRNKEAAALKQAEEQTAIAIKERDAAEEARRKETVALREAGEQKAVAIVEGDRAKASSDEARAAKKQAEKNLLDANVQREQAQKDERRSRRHLYAAEMQQAQQAWDGGDLARVEQMLARQVPKSSAQEDLRAFDWHYLATQVGFQSRSKSPAKADILRHRSAVYRVTVSADGETAVSLGRDKMARVWDLKTLHQKGLCALPKDFKWTGWIRYRKYDAAGKPIIDSWTGEQETKGEDADFQLQVTPFALSPDCTRLAAALLIQEQKPAEQKASPVVLEDKDHPANPRVFLWDVNAAREVAALTYYAQPLVFSPNGKWFAATELLVKPEPRSGAKKTHPCCIVLLNAVTGQAKARVPVDGSMVSAVIFSRDSRMLAVAGCDPSKSGKGVSPLRTKAGGSVRSGRAAAVSGSTVFWRVGPALDGGSEPERLGDIPFRVAAGAFSPDGGVFIGCSEDGKGYAWNATDHTEEPLVGFEGDTVGLSADGTFLAAWHSFSYAELENEAEPTNTNKAARRERAVAKRELEWQSHCDVQLWDVARKEMYAVLSGHRYVVRDGVFAPDGKCFATASEDGTIKLWDAVTGVERFTLKGHESGVLSVAFSADSMTLASGSRDGTIRIWRTQPANILGSASSRVKSGL